MKNSNMFFHCLVVFFSPCVCGMGPAKADYAKKQISAKQKKEGRRRRKEGNESQGKRNAEIQFAQGWLIIVIIIPVALRLCCRHFTLAWLLFCCCAQCFLSPEQSHSRARKNHRHFLTRAWSGCQILDWSNSWILVVSGFCGGYQDGWLVPFMIICHFNSLERKHTQKIVDSNWNEWHWRGCAALSSCWMLFGKSTWMLLAFSVGLPAAAGPSQAKFFASSKVAESNGSFVLSTEQNSSNPLHIKPLSSYRNKKWKTAFFKYQI